MRLKLKIIVITLLTAIAFSSCVNLQHVNEFSFSSLQGITAFEELNYSFKQSCLDKCIDKNINNLDIITTACDCKQEELADSITLKIYSSVYGYFDGLVKLSDGELTSYQTAALETALTEGDFGSITVNKNNVESYSKISRILIRAFTDSFRRNEIKEYVTEANEPVIELLTFLDFNIAANLNGKLNVKKERIKADYFDLIKDKSLSNMEKRNAVKEYFQMISEIESQQGKLFTYSNTLSKIAEGHQQLHDNIDSLKEKEIKQILFQYASEIKVIISEFNKIEG
ncbi:hypothetical protein UMM65_06335 [Aureibaculum sp. 2210JD6-5]|uniref:hypothetical protein n=1 Tax=Aureibaculum sp. 2210JD6-5 TaxID=3103957 RepID=UPI002AACCBFF|nr:hypothetical protein [Aureibaculum sp. 2210JD6-5]MDY7394852.1 hypothetical protein [Aureibaculum sp. 2210JD6-5]